MLIRPPRGYMTVPVRPLLEFLDEKRRDHGDFDFEKGDLYMW